MAAEIIGYEFGYTSMIDVGEPPVSTAVPTVFTIGGIAEEVANGILAGLQGVSSLSDVFANQILTGKVEIGQSASF